MIIKQNENPHKPSNTQTNKQPPSEKPSSTNKQTERPEVNLITRVGSSSNTIDLSRIDSGGAGRAKSSRSSPKLGGVAAARRPSN